ncbi:hypothetical protein [Comamonas sp. JC664]|uniref:hypothetical protein n=1 Tax=Comamonas sp. JC664 TaxID=2801917 RepID=UPI00188C1DC3|nr:hypothetical protein [Comamonas sp. JC664]
MPVPVLQILEVLSPEGLRTLSAARNLPGKRSEPDLKKVLIAVYDGSVPQLLLDLQRDELRQLLQRPFRWKGCRYHPPELASCSREHLLKFANIVFVKGEVPLAFGKESALTEFSLEGLAPVVASRAATSAASPSAESKAKNTTSVAAPAAAPKAKVAKPVALPVAAPKAKVAKPVVLPVAAPKVATLVAPPIAVSKVEKPLAPPVEQTEDGSDRTVVASAVRFLIRLTPEWSRPRNLGVVLVDLGFEVPGRLRSTRFQEVVRRLVTLGVEMSDAETGTIFTPRDSSPGVDARVRLRRTQ